MAARSKKSGINLIIKPEINESFATQLLNWSLTYGRYIIIITQIGVLTVFFLRFKLDREHTDLKEFIDQKQAVVESFSDLEQEIRSVQKKLVNIQTISASQNVIPNILDYVQSVTPQDTVFLSLSLRSNTIEFSATSPSLGSFNQLLRGIQNDDKFQEVKLMDLTRQKTGRIEFRIQANVVTNAFTTNL